MAIPAKVYVPAPYNGHGIMRPFDRVDSELRRRGIRVEFCHALASVDEVLEDPPELIVAANALIGMRTVVDATERQRLPVWFGEVLEARPGITCMAYNPGIEDAEALTVMGVYAIPSRRGGRPYDSRMLADTIAVLHRKHPDAVERLRVLIENDPTLFFNPAELERRAKERAGESYGDNKSRRLLWMPDQFSGPSS